MLVCACGKSELSCIIANLFAEIYPHCSQCKEDNIIICGRAYDGSDVTIIITDVGFNFIGAADTINKIRVVRCLNEKPTQQQQK